MTVVGVVGRIKQDGLDADSRMAYYRAHRQSPSRGLNVVVRSQTDPRGLASAVTREIRDLDPDLPVYNLRTMGDRVDESLARRRFAMLLLALFAAVALGLASVGVYGVIAYLVSQGTRELAVRMALGASPLGILVLVLRHGVSMAVAGIAIGLGGALALTRFMRSLLFGIEPADPLTFGAIALVLAVVALVASYVPARAARRVDPLVALREP
jgi:predicted lysophospholipase L1 biosynthesis ABC-type transport system permease subunit